MFMTQKSIEPIGTEEIVYQGKMIEVVQQRMMAGEKEQTFEFARRSPGTRLIIVTPEKKLILTKEYRREADSVDWRLPGGKVFDRLTDYNEFLKTGKDIIPVAIEAAKKEAREEAGIEVKKIEHFATSHCGATVTWDLFYFVVNDFERLTGQSLEHGEEGIELIEIDFGEARAICLDGRMQEERSVAIFMRWLFKHSNVSAEALA